MAEKEYQRLTRTAARGFIGFSRASLWLGNDHLLCVETTGYSEIYKRFYFRDIEAIVVRGTTNRNIWTMVWGVVVFLFLILGLSNESPAKEVLLSLGGLGMLGLVINLIRGPTCKCEIRTLVQTEPLPVSRVRAARKFLERVRPLITSAQGQLTPEEVTARLSEPPPAGPAPAASSPSPATIASETLDAAPASLSSPNEERAGVRSPRAQGEIFPSPSVADPNAPPPAAS